MPIVRPAREAEVRHLAELGLSAWERAIAGVVDPAGMRRVAQLAFLSFLREGWRSAIVADVGGIAVGWAARENGDGEISDLWVAPAYHRHGLGAVLLEALENEIRRAGYDEATAKTHADNAPAVAFFQKQGCRVAWLSTAYSARLDRDVDQIGFSKSWQAPEEAYGRGRFL